MSDEEKEALEYLKSHIIPYYGRKGTIEFMLNDTLLNLIEKKSKEIEELRVKNKILEAISLSFNEIQDRDKKWEDKIKVKIEEVQKMKAKAKDIVFKSSLNYIETELKSLL